MYLVVSKNILDRDIFSFLKRKYDSIRSILGRLYIMGGLKRHTYCHPVASAEPSSAARCETIYAGISSCLCIHNSSDPSPDTSGIAPPADTGRCKTRREKSEESYNNTCLDTLDRLRLWFEICSSELTRIRKETYAFFSIFIPFEFMVGTLSSK